MLDVKEDRLVPLHVFSVSDNVYNLASETVVALAKPVIDVTSLKPYEKNESGCRPSLSNESACIRRNN